MKAELRPTSNFHKKTVGQIVHQARDRIALEERVMADLKTAKAAENVLEHAILTRNYAPLVMVTDDPAY